MIKNSGYPSLRYVEITGNKSPMGGGLVFDSNLGANLINTTISANEALVGSGIYVLESSESKIVNTIIQDNQPPSASPISLSHEQEEAVIINHSNNFGSLFINCCCVKIIYFKILFWLYRMRCRT